ncbi:MarR family transcriptional regulator [Ornithinimicrobium sp. F0845]|uniref:MarR family winged helix-turn-helix transcriptional regulator n=1 Tax=Ornithinimicrobium sp. F0845 TaxID=2926412 RepID=UPI001FF6F895|nr:MarR family transcriptional regulator [Ornithinimicrobium sp. F0845]MCK0113661.1 MarR family transcriptional regulator [Ornithinimicrobium sp. F0845]
MHHHSNHTDHDNDHDHDHDHDNHGQRGHGPRGRGRPGRGPRGHGRRGGRPTPGPIDPEASELELIQHLARRLRRGSAVETAPWGLSPHQARALAVIARATGRRHRHSSDAEAAEARPAVYTGLRLGALAEWLQIAPRSATEVVDGLEELGLVARTPDPDDRRAVLVGLTDRGREVVKELRAARRAPSEQLLDALSTEERAQLRTSLLTLLEAADR